MKQQKHTRVVVWGYRIVRLVVIFFIILLGAGCYNSTASQKLLGVPLPDLGLALIVSGITALVREVFVFNLEVADRSQNVGKALANEWRLLESGLVDKVREEALVDEDGIFRVKDMRKSFSGYYTWLPPNPCPRKFYAAGRSILNRMADDVPQYGMKSVEDALAARFLEGTEIHILFLDPRSDLIGRLAEVGVEGHAALYTSIAKSIGITKSLYEKLKSSMVKRAPDNDAGLQIGIYDEIPYFAYHKVDHVTYVGFYFNNFDGFMTAVFAVPKATTAGLFEEHFKKIREVSGQTGRTLLSYNMDTKHLQFNQHLYDKLFAYLCDVEHFGSDKKHRQDEVRKLLRR